MKDDHKKNDKLHYSGKDPLNKSNGMQSHNAKLGNIDDEKLAENMGSGKTPDANTDLGNSKPDDTHTGRWQTTIIKGENPEQTQSPDVGADNNSSEEYEKVPFDAQYGKNHANKGSKMSLGSGRGEKGLSKKLPSKK